MEQLHHTLTVTTSGRGVTNITPLLRDHIAASGLHSGLATLLVQHTSCSLMIQENADPDVLRDMERFLARLVPDGDPGYRHCNEGEDDMPAHIRMALTQVSLAIPFVDGQPRLGIWQGVFLYEHRYGANPRRLALHLLGE
ncbi:MAG: secondary thiamine-phosphate synthase enzyme YjbQ [Mariprofundales bacterium]